MDKTNDSKPSPLEDPDFRAFADAWIHLTPWQKKVIYWSIMFAVARARARRYFKYLALSWIEIVSGVSVETDIRTGEKPS